MINKKVRNATVTEYNGIKFRSKQEVMCYKTLVENGFNPSYETKSYVLFAGFTTHVPFYTKNKFKRKNKYIATITKHLAQDARPIEPWLYTPDFTFEYKDYFIVIEVKGKENDVYPYKKKLFRRYLEELQHLEEDKHIEFWEIFTKQQLLECIELLKYKTNENT